MKNERKGGEFPVMGSNGIIGFHNEYYVKGPCIIVGRKGSAGMVVWEDRNCTPIDTTFYVKTIIDCDYKYLYYSLKNSNLKSDVGGTGVHGLNRNNAYKVQIPLPPLDEQKKIVKKIEAIENQISELKVICDNASDKKKAVLEKELCDE